MILSRWRYRLNHYFWTQNSAKSTVVYFLNGIFRSAVQTLSKLWRKWQKAHILVNQGNSVPSNFLTQSYEMLWGMFRSVFPIDGCSDVRFNLFEWQTCFLSFGSGTADTNIFSLYQQCKGYQKKSIPSLSRTMRGVIHTLYREIASLFKSDTQGLLWTNSV